MARKNRNARGRRQTTPYDPLAPWTMPQIQSTAQGMARDAIAPVLADLTRQQNDTAANITGFTGAMNRALAPIAGQVTDAFQTAGNASAGFGSGFADGLKMLAANAPTANGQAGGDIATALAGLLQSGAQNTSRGLGMQGAAEASFAAQYPIFATGRGSQQLEKAIQGYNQERETVQGKVPQIVTDLIQQMLDREIQKGGLRANQRALGLDEQRLDLDRDRLKEEGRQFDVNSDLARQGLALDWAKFREDAQNQNDAETLAWYDRSQARYDQAVEEGDTKTAAAVAKRTTIYESTRKDVDSVIDQINNGKNTVTYLAGQEWVEDVDPQTGRPIMESVPVIDPSTGGPLVGPDGNTVTTQKPKLVKKPIWKTETRDNWDLSFNEMFRRLKAMYGPTLQKYKFSRKTIDQLILGSMRRAGYEGIYTTEKY